LLQAQRTAKAAAMMEEMDKLEQIRGAQRRGSIQFGVKAGSVSGFA